MSEAGTNRTHVSNSARPPSKPAKIGKLFSRGLRRHWISFAGAALVFVNDKGAERFHEALSFLFFFLAGSGLRG